MAVTFVTATDGHVVGRYPESRYGSLEAAYKAAVQDEGEGLFATDSENPCDMCGYKPCTHIVTRLRRQDRI